MLLLEYTALCIIFGTIYANGGHVVHTKLGDINGKSITTEFKGKGYIITRYSGLRYAKAPIGDLRFKKPVPFGNYDSPLDATGFTSACPQNDMLNVGVDSVDEDCLSLNIYVPTEKPDRPEGFAVMTFVHGGGFAMGVSYTYPGEVLAGLGNVIVVTINYRLGLLGFANSGDGQIEGNNGLWDQQMAFQWIIDNIASFGGDASRITIFGESAGSISVMMQGLDPSNKGRFQNIIAESGTPTMPFHLTTNNLNNLKYVAENLGCQTETTDKAIKCLKTVETADLMAKMAELSKDMEGSLKIQFMPTIDDDFIKQPFLELLDESKQGHKNEQLEFFRSLNLINGINTAEGAMLLLMLGQEDLEKVSISREEFGSSVVPRMVNSLLNYDQRAVPEEMLNIIAYEHTDWNNLGDFKDAYVQFVSDFFFNAPGRDWLDAHANSSASNTYFYSFDADIEKNPLPTPSWVKGANHADELPAVFGYCISAMVNLTDYTPPSWELDLSERMMTYWSNFAKTGDPNGDIPGNLLAWPQTEADDTAYIVFSKEDSVHHDNLYGKAVAFWREIVPAIWNALDNENCHMEESPFVKKPSDTCDANGNCD